MYNLTVKHRPRCIIVIPFIKLCDNAGGYDHLFEQIGTALLGLLLNQVDRSGAGSWLRAAAFYIPQRIANRKMYLRITYLCI
jgi:hypothetical protein